MIQVEIFTSSGNAAAEDMFFIVHQAPRYDKVSEWEPAQEWMFWRRQGRWAPDVLTMISMDDYELWKSLR